MPAGDTAAGPRIKKPEFTFVKSSERPPKRGSGIFNVLELFSSPHVAHSSFAPPDRQMDPTDPASRFRTEFRSREARFLALKARRAAMAAYLPRWLRWLLPPLRRGRFW
jgi:hypothetical protein